MEPSGGGVDRFWSIKKTLGSEGVHFCNRGFFKGSIFGWIPKSPFSPREKCWGCCQCSSSTWVSPIQPCMGTLEWGLEFTPCGWCTVWEHTYLPAKPKQPCEGGESDGRGVPRNLTSCFLIRLQPPSFSSPAVFTLFLGNVHSQDEWQ